MLKNFKNGYQVSGSVAAIDRDWETPKVKTTEAQRKLSELLFGEDIYEISSGKRSNIISGKFNKNTMTPYRVKTMYDPIALELGYGKG